MTTVVTRVREWQDAPEPGCTAYDWPYPTEYVQFLVTGELADRVKERLGEPIEAAVFITEEKHSGGYSDYSQANSYEFEIRCGSRRVTFDEYSPFAGYGATTIARLAAWLDQTGAKS